MNVSLITNSTFPCPGSITFPNFFGCETPLFYQKQTLASYFFFRNIFLSVITFELMMLFSFDTWQISSLGGPASLQKRWNVYPPNLHKLACAKK